MPPITPLNAAAVRSAAAQRSKKPRGLISVALALVLAIPLLVGFPTASDAATASIFSASKRAHVKASTRTIEAGLRFTSSVDGTVTGMRFYKATAGRAGRHRAVLWTAGGKALEVTHFKATKAKGWQTVEFKQPVSIKAHQVYVVSYYSPAKKLYARTANGLAKAKSKGVLTALGSVWRGSKGFPKKRTKANFWIDVRFEASKSSSSVAVKPTTPAKPTPKPTTPAKPTPKPTTPAKPTPTPTTPAKPTPTPTPSATAKPTTPQPSATPTATIPTTPSGAWPDTSNTGVPAGTTLSAYTGPSTITVDGTVIRNQLITGTLTIRASNVQIINSRINGSISLQSPKSNDYSFTITDSEVHYPGQTGTGIMRGNFRATRIEVTGGNRSIYCEYNCVVQDSLVHRQGADVGGDAHFSGIRMEQNGTFRHNTLICEAGRGPGTGCSAALTGYGDFAPVQNNLIENNRFIGSLGGGATMCAYGGSSGDTGGKPYGHLARDIRFINNVFTRGTTGKCGNLGSIRDFDASRPGNVWSGNTWDDGAVLNP